MGTVCTAALLGCLVHLNVLDDQVAGIEAFGVGVCFCVFEKAEEEFGGFFGPASFGDAELFPYDWTPSVYDHRTPKNHRHVESVAA